MDGDGCRSGSCHAGQAGIVRMRLETLAVRRIANLHGVAA